MVWNMQDAKNLLQWHSRNCVIVVSPSATPHPVQLKGYDVDKDEEGLAVTREPGAGTDNRV